MIWTATSVLPVPGGPTTRVSPGCMPLLMASTCVGVNGMAFLGGGCGWGVRGEGEMRGTLTLRVPHRHTQKQHYAHLGPQKWTRYSTPSSLTSWVGCMGKGPCWEWCKVPPVARPPPPPPPLPGRVGPHLGLPTFASETASLAALEM